MLDLDEFAEELYNDVTMFRIMASKKFEDEKPKEEWMEEFLEFTADRDSDMKGR